MAINPALIASLFLSAASTGAGVAKQRSASKRADKQKAAAMALERQRQEELTEEGKRRAANTLEQYTPEAIDESTEAITGKNLQTMADLISKQEPVTSFTTGSAPKVIKDTMKARSDEAKDKVGIFAKALSDFTGSGQALTHAGLNTSRNAQMLDMLNRDKRISSSMLGNEILAAAMKAEDPLGTGMVSLGQTGLSTAISGGFGGVNKTPAISSTPYSPIKRPVAGYNPLYQTGRGSQFIPRWKN